jgi:type III secretion protein C
MIGFCAKHAKRLAIMAAAVLAFMTSGAALAADPPFTSKTISIAPRGQLVADTIRDLYAQAGLKVKVSSLVKDRVSGKWTGDPATIWSQLAKSFNLVAFYDGGVVRVYSASEITTESYNSAAPESVVNSAGKMGYTGGANRVKAGQNTVTATGVPEYLERIKQLATSATAPVAKVATITPIPLPTTTSGSNNGIVSPIAGRPVGLPTSTTPPTTLASTNSLNYTVMQRATIRDPYEVRIYFLKYANPDDSKKNIGDEFVTIPGIATTLASIMGDGRGAGSKITTVGRSSANRDLDYDDDDLMDRLGGGPVIIQKEQSARSVNGPTITSDTARKAVIVKDRPEAMLTYDGIIRQLDIRPTIIEIVATTIDIDVEKTKRFGVDFSFKLNALSAVLGGNPIDALGGSNSGNVQGSFLKQNTNGLAIRIDALTRTGDIRVVKTLSLSTVENVPATLDNRTEIALRATGRSREEGRSVRVGSLLTIRPSIAKETDQLLTILEIDLRDGTITGFLDDGSPIVTPSNITSTTFINQGESLIIGGVTISSDQDINSKVPVLGDIPLAGEIFKKRNKTSRQFERVVIITPRIISNQSGPPATAIGYSAPIPLEQIQGVAQQDAKPDKKSKKRKKLPSETTI